MDLVTLIRIEPVYHSCSGFMEGVEDVSDVMLSTCSTIFHQTHLIKLKVLQGQKSWRNKFNKILIILLTSLIMYVKTRCGMLSYWHTFFFSFLFAFFFGTGEEFFPTLYILLRVQTGQLLTQ